MPSNGSSIKLVVSPDVPHDIIDETFEGALIRRMVGVLRTKDGYELFSNDGVENAAVNLDELVKLAKASDSRFAMTALPMVTKSAAIDEPFFLDEFGAALGIENFDLAHVLQEFCRMYPDRITHFEIAWSEVTNAAMPEFGRLGGGADFITADGIESINAKSWLDGKRQALAWLRDFGPGWGWQKVDGRDVWRALIPHSNWIDIAANESQHYFEVARIEITLSGHQYKLINTQMPASPLFYADKEQAFGEADRLYDKAALGCRSAVIRSMGLDPDEWRFSGVDGELAVTRVGSAGQIAMFYNDGQWALYNRDDLLATGEEPADVVAMLNKAEAVFKV